jgi:glycosyltransferase involved in cell wall biosynthesis
MAAERAASVIVDRIVGVSEAMTEALHRHLRIPRRKLYTIANGVESSSGTSAADRVRALERLQLPDGARLVGTASRLVWEKGLSHLLEAWNVVRQAEPNAVLLIAGDGPERTALEALTDSLALRSHVRFLGMRDDVAALLSSLDVFVMPSVSEGLPMALLEAMAVGRPIVATNIGGMPDALAAGEAGLIVPPADPAALATAIIQLLNDPGYATRIGAAAASRFQERYTARAMARAYEDLYLAGASA